MAVAEISVIPVGHSTSISDEVADVIKIIEESGMHYKVNPMCTVIQGDIDELFDLMKQCHHQVAEKVDRVFTTIIIDDRKGVADDMERKMHSVEAKVGKKLE
ncbi:MAG TPA: MTH1187 family thiamine-binding protein [Planctomycetota bacterium]|nr:MTH1187 family thiamine-binding protein [Planctomycetota bacterium]